MTLANATALESVELRRYVMKPGRRDDLIAIFERDFIEGQEACGMTPVGHYRDPRDADAFIWLRGFRSAAHRRAALEAFYERSEVWKRNRSAANDTMIDSDNVLMLRPLFPQSGFDLRGLQRPAPQEAAQRTSVVAVAIFMLSAPISEAAAASFERDILARLRACAQRVAVFVTDDYPNEFPRLPVRDERALVVIGIPGHDEVEQWEHTLQTQSLPDELRGNVIDAEFLRLEPAARSLYR